VYNRLMKRNLILTLASLLFATASFAQTANHGVDLSWTWSQGTGSAGTGFNVKRATVTGGPYSILTTTAIAARTYSDNSATGNVLTEGATYFYVVTAIGNCKDANGVVTVCESTPSNEVSAKIPFQVVLPPNAPTNLQGPAH
jgi:hypothetical protein